MANANRDGRGAVNSGKGHEDIVQGRECAGEKNKNGKVMQWEHAGHLDNFAPTVGNNNAQKGKELCSPTSRGRRRNGVIGWIKGKRDFSNGNGVGGWKGKRASSNEIGRWNAKRAASDGIGGNGGSQISNGGNRVGKVQTLGNNAYGFNGHRVSLHFPVQSPQLQKILRGNFSLLAPIHGFQGQVNDPRPPPRQVNDPPVPFTPPSPPPANAVQVYQPPVQNRTSSRKVRVTQTPEGNWVMEAEEYI